MCFYLDINVTFILYISWIKDYRRISNISRTYVAIKL